MIPRERLLPADFRPMDLWLTLGLGAGGFLLNMLELQLGWGMHFMFGNALIYGWVRLLRPPYLVLAISLSSLRSLILWNHPWAWAIWTIEAIFITSFRKSASPARSDVLFWIVIGSPLVALTYGQVMGMDRLSLLLVIAKQATNGVLNVVLGEVCYVVALGLNLRRRRINWPKMPIQSFMTTLLLAIILIPTTAYLYIDAPSREQAARTKVDQSLQERLRITEARLSMWAQSRGLVLRMAAERQQDGRSALPPALAREFSGMSLTANPPQGTDRASNLQLITLGGPDRSAVPRLALVVPFTAAGRRAAILAPLRPGVLERIVGTEVGLPEGGTFLSRPSGAILSLTQGEPGLVDKVRRIPPDLRAAALHSAVLVSSATYGNALMSDLRDARMARTSAIAALPGWHVLAIASLSPEVLAAREGQLQLFTALSAFMVMATLVASFLSKQTERSFRHLAHSAANLAMLGTRRDKIDRLVIAELNEISGQIASANSRVWREHGALVSYQRRLDSIARHAPIVVYALDVQDDQKGELVYVSEALETILGYTRAEAAQPGWWNHAVHPEDLDHCTAAFRNLRAGTVVSVEYRLRHRRGHYVWFYDTLSVEANPASDHVEAVGVLIDISERKAATEQLLQADKMASLGRMISGTTHEINQPLNFIKMAISNLRERARRDQLEPAEVITRLDGILAQVDRASAIILQMRIFGRTAKEAPFPITVTSVVEAVLTMAAPQLELDGTRVETAPYAPGVKVRALSVLLEQVILNLIINANDAIRARRNSGDLRKGWIRIGVSRQGGQAIITVDDNGTGLPPDVLPAIFEPFFTTKPPKEGTGLGLSISYGIIRDLGGSIRAENTGSGARFVIELPQAD